ncbi:hypothetical protein FSY75_29855 [Streptomyces sp. TR1341]|uniref:hypothetical protein n=1 Tax=Streptomyces sp. TR1341 TaxID=2601266 RepID=UPI00138AB274|nr:hypothetical protein [Streptomyces sp. TR1341]
MNTSNRSHVRRRPEARPLVLTVSDWVMEPGGWVVELDGSWCNQDVLVTGDLVVPGLPAEQIATRDSRFPQYAG